MTANAKKRWYLVAALIAGVAILAAILLNIGLSALRGQVEKALGPDSEVSEIRLGWLGVEVVGLRLKGGKGWPAADALRAERILVQPDLRSLFSERIYLSAIVIDNAYLSALRSTNGKLRVIPSLLEQPSAKSGDGPKISIGRVELRNAALELYDATIARPPFKVRIEKLDATADTIDLPRLDSRTAIDLKGIVKGRHREGRVSIKGWIVMSSLDSAIASRFRDIDLVALRPYLIKTADTGVREGTLDLDLDSNIERRRLRAPGVITLRHLELDESHGFMGFARRSAVNLLKSPDETMTLRFTLEGNLDDPTFSVNDDLATRFGAALGETLGVSVESVAKGVGSLGQQSLEAASGTTGGLGQAVRNLFGK